MAKIYWRSWMRAASRRHISSATPTVARLFWLPRASGLQRVASCIAIGAIGSFGPELRGVFQRSYPGEWITEDEKREHGISDAARFTGAWVRATTRIIDAGGDISLSNAHRITCPLIIMLGKEDKLNPKAFGGAICGARLVRASGSVRLWPCRARSSARRILSPDLATPERRHGLRALKRKIEHC